MHDIKWIRDNPDAFDRALEAARPVGRGEAADRHRRAPPRRDPGVGGGAGAPQRRLTRNRRRQEEQRGRARAGADGRGREAQGRHPAARGRGEGGGRRTRQGACRNSQPAARRGAGRRRRDRQCRAPPFRRAAQLRLHAEAAFRAGRRRSARWISRPRRNCRARASSCSRAGSRGWSARSGSSCSTCTPASTAIPKCRRRCWCATR